MFLVCTLISWLRIVGNQVLFCAIVSISATAFLPDYTNRDISQEHDAVAPAASAVV
jgi:hypothetical protein